MHLWKYFISGYSNVVSKNISNLFSMEKETFLRKSFRWTLKGEILDSVKLRIIHDVNMQ